MTTRKNFPERRRIRQEEAAERQEQRNKRSAKEQLTRIPEHCKEAVKLRRQVEKESK